MGSVIANSDLRDQLGTLYPNLLRFASSLTSSHDRAEDRTQETMASAIRFQDRFEPGTNARAWLFTIVAGCANGAGKGAVRAPASGTRRGGRSWRTQR